MCVGKSQILQDALDRSILAKWAMQRIEGDVRPEVRQHLSDVASDVDPRDAIALCLKRVRAGIPGLE